MKTRTIILCGSACLCWHAASAAILHVGPGEAYATIQAAVDAASDGDTVEVQSGTYTNQTVSIVKSITLTAVGGRVSVPQTVAVPNQKGIFVVGSLTTTPRVTIDGFDFSGATTPFGNNAAGVVYQSGYLTLTNDSFHDNQDGIRGAPNTVGSVLIDHCEFANNGINDGLTHNVYIGIIPQFTIQNSYTHDPKGGHEIKSRALNTYVVNNRIFDNAGNGSYQVDIPQGGNVTITGNVIQQGANNANPNIIAYGEENVTQNPGNSVSVSNNVFVNDDTAHAPVVMFNQRTETAVLTDNSYWGITSGQIAGGSGPTSSSGDVFLGSRPTLDTTTVPYMTTYPVPSTLSVVAGRLTIAAGKLALVPPGSNGGGTQVAGAWTDDNGTAITDDDGTAITD
jgi:hypothetical protein